MKSWLLMLASTATMASRVHVPFLNLDLEDFPLKMWVFASRFVSVEMFISAEFSLQEGLKTAESGSWLYNKTVGIFRTVVSIIKNEPQCIPALHYLYRTAPQIFDPNERGALYM